MNPRYVGVDIGSITVKVVLVDGHKRLLASRYVQAKGRPWKVLTEVLLSLQADTDLGAVTEFMGGRPHPGKDRVSGHFGFAGHSDPVQFRNVKLKRL